jgi:hypothetical protein
MFDMAMLIDYKSTDRSLEIIRNEAPKTWQIVPSRNKNFEATLVDNEVVDYEKMHPNAWKIALHLPEFLVHYNLRQMLDEVEHPMSRRTGRKRVRNGRTYQKRVANAFVTRSIVVARFERVCGVPVFFVEVINK